MREIVKRETSLCALCMRKRGALGPPGRHGIGRVRFGGARMGSRGGALGPSYNAARKQSRAAEDERRDTTRLETRTKESIYCASIMVLNQDAQGKRRLLGFNRAQAEAIRQHASMSTSTVGGTRKAVNYARPGQRQRKLWWRPVAVLTCKSMARAGYRGERLIELPSSWFPLKFPSG